MFSPLTSLLTRKARFPRSLSAGLFVLLTTQASALSMPQRLFGAGSSHAFVCARSPLALPYLAQLGAAPLRFAPPPPDPVERPAPVEVKPTAAPTAAVAEPAATPVVATASPVSHEPVASSGPKPVSILPDDTPREIRAEDVLPYFQLPRQGERSGTSGVNLPFTPALPASLPPSSATYQLK